ncbi:hypothetical protein AB0J83_17670, partial [Actinoplanes sp. NPDC049596]
MMTVLGAQAMDRNAFVGMPWISATNVYASKKPPTGTPGANRFNFYAPILSEAEYYPAGYGGTQIVAPYLVVEGLVNWYDGGTGNSPHDHYVAEFLTHTNNALGSGPTGSVLNPASMDTAAEGFYNTWVWLGQAQQRIQQQLSQVDSSGSDFQGSAAQAFSTILKQLRDQLKMLETDIKTNKDWVQMLHDNAAAARTFWSQVQSAWNNYYLYKPDPSRIVADALNQIEAQARSSPLRDRQNWPMTLDFGNGARTYNMLDSGVFAQLNTDMQNFWRNEVNELDQTMTNQVAALMNSFDDTRLNMTDIRAYNPPPPSSGTGSSAGGSAQLPGSGGFDAGAGFTPPDGGGGGGGGGGDAATPPVLGGGGGAGPGDAGVGGGNSFAGGSPVSPGGAVTLPGGGSSGGLGGSATPGAGFGAGAGFGGGAGPADRGASTFDPDGVDPSGGGVGALDGTAPFGAGDTGTFAGTGAGALPAFLSARPTADRRPAATGGGVVADGLDDFTDDGSVHGADPAGGGIGTVSPAAVDPAALTPSIDGLTPGGPVPAGGGTSASPVGGTGGLSLAVPGADPSGAGSSTAPSLSALTTSSPLGGQIDPGASVPAGGGASAPPIGDAGVSSSAVSGAGSSGAGSPGLPSLPATGSPAGDDVGGIGAPGGSSATLPDLGSSTPASLAGGHGGSAGATPGSFDPGFGPSVAGGTSGALGDGGIPDTSSLLGSNGQQPTSGFSVGPLGTVPGGGSGLADPGGLAGGFAAGAAGSAAGSA